jgi:hypothetical protein
MTDRDDDHGRRPPDGPSPLAIQRIDILDQDDGGAALIIWAGDRRERLLLRFPTRREALNYCREIWEQRQSAFEAAEDEDEGDEEAE